MSSICHWREEKFSERKVAEMLNYSFVLDLNGNQLSPTLETKAWYMIRKKKATLVSKYPMVIQLNRSIPVDEICKDEIRCGIDDGAKYVGIALVQKCKTRNKVLLKGTIEHRNDVHNLMAERLIFRRFRRRNKRYRPARRDNRKASTQKGKIYPTILQKKQAIVRVIKQLKKWVNFTTIYLEDVAIDIRVLINGFKPPGWVYRQSTRLDENLRLAVLKRDRCTCMLCGRTDGRKEVHHIKPRRLHGSDTVENLITLCVKCHEKVTGVEEQYMAMFYQITESTYDRLNIRDAFHVMQGKTWLRNELSKLGMVQLTTGGDTANKRLVWDIKKTHANDAVCITDLQPSTIDVAQWTIKPMRRQNKATIAEYKGLKHRDLIKYTPKGKQPIIGYITAISPKRNSLNFRGSDKVHTRVSINSCTLLWRFSKIYWIPEGVLW